MGSGFVRNVSQLYSVLAQLTEPGIVATWGCVHGRYCPFWYLQLTLPPQLGHHPQSTIYHR